MEIPLAFLPLISALYSDWRQTKTEPFVKVSTLDLVSVVVEGPRVDPRDSLLPPAPISSISTPQTDQPSPIPTNE